MSSGRRRPCLASRFLAAIVVSLPVTAAGEDWPQWRGPRRNGISEETVWRHDWGPGGPPVLWRASVGTGYSSFAVAAGRVFTMGNRDNEDTVYGFEADTGRELWKQAYVCPLEDKFFAGGPTSTPTVDAELVYTLSRQGDLFCFEVATGQIRWTKQIAEEAHVRVPGWGFAASPVVLGDKLLLAVGEAGTLVDKLTGQLIWTSADADAGYATPLPFDWRGRALALIASGKYYHAVDVGTGQEAWRMRWLTRFGCNAADPILVGERLLLSSGYNRGSTLLQLTGGVPEAVWNSKDFQNQFSSSVLLDGHVYGIDGDTTSARTLKCVRWETGEVLWSEAGLGSGSLLAADKRLVILAESGELVIAEATPQAFQPLARAQVLSGPCWTVPVLANGRLYCRNADGDVVCLDLRR